MSPHHRITELRRALLAERLPNARWSRGEELRHAVRHLVLIGSSSRGGSSVFTEYLRTSRSMVHLRAEMNAFLVMTGLAHPRSGTGSDALGAQHARDADPFLLELGLDCGRPTNSVPDAQLLEDIWVRLRLQWPFVDLRREDVEAAWDATEAAPGSPDFWAQLLTALSRRAPIDPLAYDLSRAAIAEETGPASAEGPPGPLLLEEPPFVCIEPWEAAGPEALGAMPLVIKTPSNAYRLPFFRALFPNARLQLVHLTRNPAASINGLYDGWRFRRGFFSHRVDSPLEIPGYSDLGPAWARHWWNFDLFEGWQQATRASLPEVCARQWHAAHAALLRDRHLADEVFEIAFEDVIGPPERSRTVLDRLNAWMGITPDDALTQSTVADMPLVMATDKPRARRWFDRIELIEPQLARPEIKEMAGRLGYGQDPADWD